MKLKWAVIISTLLHSAVFGILSSGIDWSLANKKKTLPIEARLVVKKARPKDRMPKKQNALPPPVNENKKTEPAKKQEKAEVVPSEKIVPISDVVKNDKKAKKLEDASQKTSNFSKTLASLSESFAKELSVEKKEEEVEPEGEPIDDSSYFDQLYTLIKGSFVVPPHIDGPKGKDLQAVERIFLASDGSLNELLLESSSGDEHFDKAVIDGTKRVHNFGAVPLFLQDVLRERGVVVELCPFKCKDQ